MLPGIDGVGFFGRNFLGIADEFVDGANRLLVRIGLAEVEHELGDGRLLDRAHVNIVYVLVEQEKISSAHVALGPVEQ